MSGFSAAWLDLREPADRAARSSALVEALRAHHPPSAPWTVVDLGAGTGANLRYLAPALGGRQQWLLVDEDAALLEAARVALARWAGKLGAAVDADEHGMRIGAPELGCDVRSVRLDLAHDLPELAVPRGSLVTASALLDLVSAEWLEALADICRAAEAEVIFALTYDGRIEVTPGAGDDAFAAECFNRHQRRDKGFGPALGPGAAAAAARIFASRGYALEEAPSPWRLDGRRDRRLQAELLHGWLVAALEAAPESRARLEHWHAEHRRHVDSGAAGMRVGHRDIAGRLRA